MFGTTPVSLNKWKQLGFSEETFRNYPDLVDFTFQSHLHRHVKHPYYKHTIDMRPLFVRKEGRVVIENHPHLLMNGKSTPWSRIREKIRVDAKGNLYSIEEGKTRLWTYLKNGLTVWDRHNLERPQALRRLITAPPRSRIEIITTHAHKKEWNLLDRVLNGTRHSLVRVVPGEGFSSRYPHQGLEEGKVYSLGWGAAKWEDFSLCNPLSTLRGKWSSPDPFEFYKQDLCVTPEEVSDEKLIRLMDVIRKKKGDALTAQMLRVRATNRVKALFSNVFDLFSPSKMEFDLTKNIYKWQKRMPQTYFEKRE